MENIAVRLYYRSDLCKDMRQSSGFEIKVYIVLELSDTDHKRVSMK